MFRVLLCGKYPERRHDGVLFRDSQHPNDQARALKAGKPLPFRAVLQKKSGDWAWMNPVLKVKAAEARAMVPVVQQHMFPKNTGYQRLRFNMLSKPFRCYELLKDFDAIEMGSSARRFHMLYNELSAIAMRNNQPHRWRLYPKFHLMIHLAESGENPRL